MTTQYEDAEIAGITPNTGPDIMDDIKDRSAWRWIFNPAAKIDVRDRIVGDELVDGTVRAISYIKAGTLTPLRNKTYNSPRPKDQPPPPGSTPAQQRLVSATKYAKDIATELEFAYADTGALIIESLTGIEDEKLVNSIFRLCVGPRIQVATDPLLPGEKIPVIPAMLEYLNFQAPQTIEKAFADKEDPKLRQIIEETRRLLIASCNSSVSGWARATAEESRQSIADRSGGHPGKSRFDSRDRRVFASMGESVPTDIQASKPTLEKGVELLLQQSLNAPKEDPRVALLEAALKAQQEETARLAESINLIQSSQKPERATVAK